jgi:hypothetical protein
MRSCAGRHRRNLRERTTGCASRAVTQTGWLPRLPRVVLAELHVDRAGAAQSPRSLRGRDRSALRAMPPFERSTTPASLSLGSVSRRHQRIAVRAGVFAFSGDRALLTLLRRSRVSASGQAMTMKRRRAALLRQLHLAQECLPSPVAVQALHQHGAVYGLETGVVLLIRAIEPGEGLIDLSAIGESFSDVQCMGRRIHAFHFRQCRVGLGSAAERKVRQAAPHRWSLSSGSR